MRNPFALLLIGICALAACRGSERGTPTDRGSSAGPAVDSASPSTPGAVTAAPITGTVHEVKMLGDAKGYRYDPAEITVKPGDGVRFVNVTGGPHNVAFDAATIPSDVREQLWANMPNAAGGSSPVLSLPNETWTLSLGNIKPGTYPYYCVPHLVAGMKGVITVKP